MRAWEALRNYIRQSESDEENRHPVMSILCEVEKDRKLTKITWHKNLLNLRTQLRTPEGWWMRNEGQLKGYWGQLYGSGGNWISDGL